MRNDGKDALEGLRKTDRVFAHLDELLSEKPNVDVNLPLKTILNACELFSKQADTHLEFRRPDIALKEYIKASITVVDIIPRHRDFAWLGDRSELQRQYTDLKNKINSQHSTFMQIKELIRENNLRNGTSSTNKAQTSSAPHPRPATLLDKHTDIDTQSNSHQKKASPAIHPKPNGLHGSALPEGVGAGKVSDLAARFARLQNNGFTQDPRIKTQLISNSAPKSAPPNKTESRSSMIRPLGPRSPPPAPSRKPDNDGVPLHASIPGLPRQPDAIHHSPLRAADHSEVPNMPSSVARVPSYLGTGRPDSAPPISTVGPSKLTNYVSPEQTSSHQNGRGNSESTSRKNPSLPGSSTISAEELMEYLKQAQQGLKLLLVDLRDREAYDSGHILSQSVICVEPITLRSGISGEQLEDCMVIATSREQDLFERRHEVDLLIFYDQSTAALNASGRGAVKTREEEIIANFVAAVWDYGYDKRLRHQPIMLSGGLNAWIDLLGPNCLQSSAGQGTLNGSAAGADLSRHLASNRRQTSNTSKRKARASRLKTSEEEQKWSEALRAEALPTRSDAIDSTAASDLAYARTTDDFFRRFPEVPVQESMMSSPTHALSSYDHALNSSLPRPPTRPAPALPRSRSSGITSKSTGLHYAQSTGQSITDLTVVPGQTGMNNPGALCYMNSAIQLLAHTPALNKLFTRFLSNPHPVPQNPREPTPNAQLMSKILGNLFIHLSSGQYKFFDAKTFRGYVNALHCNLSRDDNVRLREYAYGSNLRQHDSGEFLIWLLDVLEDELNINRDVAAMQVSDEQSVKWAQDDAMAAAIDGDKFLRQTMDGPLVEEMGCLYSETIICRSCNRKERRLRGGTSLQIAIGAQATTNYTTFLQHIADTYHNIEFLEARCEQCGGEGKDKITRLCRLPDTLLIFCGRGAVDTDSQGNSTANTGKSEKIVETPETMDLSSLFEEEQASSSVKQHGFSPPHQYRVRAATEHIGKDLTKGHYITYARTKDDQNSESWYQFNDRRVQKWTWDEAQKQALTVVMLERIKP